MTDVLEQKGYFVDPVFGLENLKIKDIYRILTKIHTVRAIEDPYDYTTEAKSLLKEKPELKNILANNGFVKDNGQIDWPSHIVDKFGFRSDNWETGEKGIIFLGCSDMFGYGNYLENTTAHIVAKYFNLKNYNLSIPGGGLDQIYRVFKYHVKNINSDTVVLLVPEASRRVFYSKSQVGNINANFVTSDHYLDRSFLEEVFIKLYCNEYICEKYNKRLIMIKNPIYYSDKDSCDLDRELIELGGIEFEGQWRPDDIGADLCHFGAKGQKLIADKIISKF
jgi:hypothetical protein